MKKSQAKGQQICLGDEYPVQIDDLCTFPKMTACVLTCGKRIGDGSDSCPFRHVPSLRGKAGIVIRYAILKHHLITKIGSQYVQDGNVDVHCDRGVVSNPFECALMLVNSLI